MKKLAQILILLTILLFTAGCAAQNQAQTPTSALELETPSSTPAPTATLTPVPTAAPLPTPAKALSGPGPWLVYARSEDASLFIRNIDGEHSVELQPPAGKKFKIQLSNVSSSKGRFTVLLQGLDINTLDLAVYHMPESGVEFQTTLVSDEAIEIARQTDSQNALFLFSDYGKYLKWSPDGRYLAFVSSGNFPGNSLMLYDTQTGEQQMLLEIDSMIRLIDWSPDGEFLIYYSWDLYGEYIIENGFIHGLHLSSGDIMDFGEIPEFVVDVTPLGWLSNQRLAVINEMYEFSPGNLRLIDVGFENETEIYADNIGSVTLNPESATFVFDIWRIAWRGEEPDLPEEIQTITYPNLEVVPLPLRGYTYFEWHPSLELFSAVGSDKVILFNTAGEITLQFPYRTSAGNKVYPSPDGRYILAAADDILSLMTIDGISLNNYLETRIFKVLWWPDSEGFYWWTTEGNYRVALYRSTAANQWQAELIDLDISTDVFILVNP